MDPRRFEQQIADLGDRLRRYEAPPAPKEPPKGLVQLKKKSADGRVVPAAKTARLASATGHGLQTVLYYQDFEGKRYVTAACLLPAARPPQPTPAACR